MQQCVMSGWQVAEMSILGPASGWAAWSKWNSWATCLLWGLPVYRYVQFSSVAQSCPTLSNPMDCSMSGFPVHHQPPELAQTHVHWVSNAIQPSHPLPPSPPAFNLSQHQGLFQWVSSSYQVAKKKVILYRKQKQGLRCWEQMYWNNSKGGRVEWIGRWGVIYIHYW